MWGIRVCNGVEEWRKAARDQVQIGTDFVKVLITGGAIGHVSDITGATTVVEEELQAAAQGAHSRNRPLIVHATAREGILMGIRAGARSIEHGYYLDEEATALPIKTGTCPTLSITHQVPSQLTDEYERAAFAANQRAPWKVKRAEERLEAHRASFRLALQAGVKMLVGSDFAPHPGAGHCEMAFMVRDGMSPWQAIVAATRNAAEAVGALDHLGTVEAGKLADLIGVAENPLGDVRSLRHPKLVLRGGQVAVDDYTWKEVKRDVKLADDHRVQVS
jgi:imidazolonepropionase-like amidohydrolase